MVKHPSRVPGSSVADHVQAALGAASGHVEQVGGLGREPAGSGSARVTPEHEDHHVRFLALHGVDRTDPVLTILTRYRGGDLLMDPLGLLRDVAERGRADPDGLTRRGVGQPGPVARVLVGDLLHGRAG